MAGVLAFMESPLVLWVRTFGDHKNAVDFQEICDGVFLNDVMVQIDHRDLDIEQDIKRVVKDTNAKIQNWALLMRNIYNYYQDVLQQLVVMETPDIISIVKDPTKECSLASIRKVLLLLLGCAIQCDRKEDYINVIKTLDISIQQAMVAAIQEVTDTCDNILDTDGVIGEKELIRIIRTMVEERNNLALRLLPLTQERDYYKHELVDKHGGPLTAPVHLEKYQLYKELGDWKHKSNKLIEDVEEKSKIISDLQEDLHDVNDKLLKVKAENVSLSRDAKAVQSYRDELDSLKEKAWRVDRCEKDIARYKERLGELDFYKGRVEELRKDNDALVESRSLLDEQLAQCQRKQESTMDELVRAQLHIDEVIKEKDQLSGKLQELVEENSALEFEKRKASEGYGGNMRRFTSTTSMDFGSQHQLPGHSISDELQETMSSQVTRMEMERDEMKQELDDAKQRLCEAQQMLKKVQNDTEEEIQRKVAELERQSKHLRNQTSKELSEQYHHKMEELEQHSMDTQNRISRDCQTKVTQLEQERQGLQQKAQDLETKLSLAHSAWKTEKEHNQRLDLINHDLTDEKEQLKTRIENLQEKSAIRIQDLDMEVVNLREKLQSIRDENGKICSLCKHRINEDSRMCDDLTSDSENNRLNDSSVYDRHDSRKPLVRSFSLHRDPCPDQVSQGSQTSPSPARISYNGDSGSRTLPPDAKYQDENKNKKTKSKFLDILRPKVSSNTRQGSPVPNRPSTVLGVVHENRSASLPQKGVHGQRHSVPNSPSQSPFKGQAPFRRNDRLRSTIQHTSSSHQHRPSSSSHQSRTPDYAPFSRGDRLRSTMPEKRSGYSVSDRHHHMGAAGSRSSVSSMDSNTSSRHHHDNSLDMSYGTDLDSSILAYLDRAMCPRNLSREMLYSSDKDSGCPTSPDTPTTPTSDRQGHVPGSEKRSHTPGRGGGDHHLTGFEVISSEMIKTQIRTMTSTCPKAAEKWQALVNKIVDLQDKNNRLIGDNSELRKSLNTAKFSGDRVDILEKRNLELEVENRKMHKIVESLQSTLEGLNQYDKRTYHFYSNV